MDKKRKKNGWILVKLVDLFRLVEMSLDFRLL